jgi:hypothetical protein
MGRRIPFRPIAIRHQYRGTDLRETIAGESAEIHTLFIRNSVALAGEHIGEIASRRFPGKRPEDYRANFAEGVKTPDIAGL